MQWPPTCTPSISTPPGRGRRAGSPAPVSKLRWGLRDKPATDCTLACPPRADGRTQRFQTPPILAGGHADEHLLDDAPVERVGVRKGLHRRQRDLVAVAPDTWSAHRNLTTAQHDFARRMACPVGAPRGLMCIPRPAHGHSILFQHGFEHLQARVTTSSWSSACVSIRMSTNGRCRGAGDSDWRHG